jgi:hypothetical protein
VNGQAQFWLAVGTPENWLTAFDYGGIWGLKSSQRRFWEAMGENTDLVFFYATVPVGGVIGFGIIRTKLQQVSPLWPEERANDEVIWPLRFEFDVLSAVPPRAWREERIVIEALKARARGGFQSLEKEHAQVLIHSLPGAKPEDLVLTHPIGLRAKSSQLIPTPQAEPAHDPHGRAQNLLVEIGRLQKFVADAEFPIENRRVDVVWRRVQRSVPSYVFEVQVSGNLTEALGKLKQARDLWNSNIFLVGKEEHRIPAKQLLSGTFHEIRDRLRFIELTQVEDLYLRKQAYRELENQLGIIV